MADSDPQYDNTISADWNDPVLLGMAGKSFTVTDPTKVPPSVQKLLPAWNGTPYNFYVKPPTVYADPSDPQASAWVGQQTNSYALPKSLQTQFPKNAPFDFPVNVVAKPPPPAQVSGTTTMVVPKANQPTTVPVAADPGYKPGDTVPVDAGEKMPWDQAKSSYAPGDPVEDDNPNRAKVASALSPILQQYPNVPMPIALGVAGTESNYQHTDPKTGQVIQGPAVTDPKTGKVWHAQGVMQLSPDTAASLGVDPTDMTQNLTGGVKSLSQRIAQAKGNIPLALTQYGGFSDPTSPQAQQYVAKVYTAAGLPVPASARIDDMAAQAGVQPEVARGLAQIYPESELEQRIAQTGQMLQQYHGDLPTAITAMAYGQDPSQWDTRLAQAAYQKGGAQLPQTFPALQAYVKNPVQFGFGHEVGQSLTMGAQGPLEAAINNANAPQGSNYRLQRDLLQASQTAYNQQNPIASGAADVLGAAVPMALGGGAVMQGGRALAAGLERGGAELAPSLIRRGLGISGEYPGAETPQTLGDVLRGSIPGNTPSGVKDVSTFAGNAIRASASGALGAGAGSQVHADVPVGEQMAAGALAGPLLHTGATIVGAVAKPVAKALASPFKTTSGLRKEAQQRLGEKLGINAKPLNTTSPIPGYTRNVPEAMEGDNFVGRHEMEAAAKSDPQGLQKTQNVEAQRQGALERAYHALVGRGKEIKAAKDKVDAIAAKYTPDLSDPAIPPVDTPSIVKHIQGLLSSPQGQVSSYRQVLKKVLKELQELPAGKSREKGTVKLSDLEDAFAPGKDFDEAAFDKEMSEASGEKPVKYTTDPQRLMEVSDQVRHWINQGDKREGYPNDKVRNALIGVKDKIIEEVDNALKKKGSVQHLDAQQKEAEVELKDLLSHGPGSQLGKHFFDNHLPKLSAKTGNEHGEIYDPETNSIVATREGDPASIPLTIRGTGGTKDPAKALILHHSHPDYADGTVGPAALSPADLANNAAEQGRGYTLAHNSAGHYYAGRSLHSESDPITGAFDPEATRTAVARDASDALKQAWDIVQQRTPKNVSREDQWLAASHIAMEVQRAAGQIEYHTNYQLPAWAKGALKDVTDTFLGQRGLKLPTGYRPAPAMGNAEGMGQLLRDSSDLHAARSGGSTPYDAATNRANAISDNLDKIASLRQQIEDIKSGKVQPQADGKTLAERNAKLSDAYDELNALKWLQSHNALDASGEVKKQTIFKMIQAIEEGNNLPRVSGKGNRVKAVTDDQLAKLKDLYDEMDRAEKAGKSAEGQAPNAYDQAKGAFGKILMPVGVSAAGFAGAPYLSKLLGMHIPPYLAAGVATAADIALGRRLAHAQAIADGIYHDVLMNPAKYPPLAPASPARPGGVLSGPLGGTARNSQFPAEKKSTPHPPPKT